MNWILKSLVRYNSPGNDPSFSTGLSRCFVGWNKKTLFNYLSVLTSGCGKEEEGGSQRQVGKLAIRCGNFHPKLVIAFVATLTGSISAMMHCKLRSPLRLFNDF